MSVLLYIQNASETFCFRRRINPKPKSSFTAPALFYPVLPGNILCDWYRYLETVALENKKYSLRPLYRIRTAFLEKRAVEFIFEIFIFGKKVWYLYIAREKR